MMNRRGLLKSIVGAVVSVFAWPFAKRVGDDSPAIARCGARIALGMDPATGRDCSWHSWRGRTDEDIPGGRRGVFSRSFRELDRFDSGARN